ncbi:HEPN domain-containing protein [Methanoplanus limicola]|uniref:HEPN domain-containing protein n=1 Tax=Methanoplanus limicola DSM 2279 TaxID=937775 RepID=H1Z062_9EURY|nr:HEPN domain-containing protein [Methanoplanus limicola]EHQ36154.1 hypothetical protein Metlim_2069 [Methanoplanus limicola DSM 2279]
MTFFWPDILLIVKFLQENKGKLPKEAADRTIISRSYYAAFSHVKYYAGDNLDFRPNNNPEDHLLIRSFLRSKGEYKLARKLQDLRGWRNNADYDDPAYTVNENNVKMSIKYAEDIIEAFK